MQRAEVAGSRPRVRLPRRARPRKRGQSAVRRERQLEQPVLAPGRLADRRQHAGGDVGGAGPGTRRARAPAPAGLARPRARRRRGRSRRRRRSPRRSCSCVAGCHGTLLPGRADLAIIPAPALPGSGSDGRRPVAALSALCGRAPVLLQDTPRHGPQAKHAIVLDRYFEPLEQGDVERAVELTTDDVVVDRRNSNAPWGRAVTSGQDGVPRGLARSSAQWNEIGGVRWEKLRDPARGSRASSRSRRRISGRGPSTGLAMDARGGWLISFAGESDQRVRPAPELRRGAARRPAAGDRRGPALLRLRGAARTAPIRARCSTRRCAAGST